MNIHSFKLVMIRFIIINNKIMLIIGKLADSANTFHILYEFHSDCLIK